MNKIIFDAKESNSFILASWPAEFGGRGGYCEALEFRDFFAFFFFRKKEGPTEGDTAFENQVSTI